MTGMEDNQPHSFQDAALDTFYNFIGYLVVREMSPPDEDISLLETFSGKAMFWLIECRGANLYMFFFS